MFQIDLKKFLLLQKLKILFCGHMLTVDICDLNGKEIVGMFYEKELQKPNQKQFRVDKVIRRKGNKLYVHWKGYNNYFKSWIEKKYINEYFPKPKSLGANVNIELDLSNYATKADLKYATGQELCQEN